MGRLLMVWAAFWAVLEPTPSLAREAVRVWLVAASAGAEDEALGRRLAAELAGQGFSVARAPVGTGHDEVLRLPSAEVRAAIWVDARARRTEVWMVRPGAVEGRLEQVIASATPGSAGVLALRTVEFLRASLGAPAPAVAAPPAVAVPPAEASRRVAEAVPEVAGRQESPQPTAAVPEPATLGAGRTTEPPEEPSAAAVRAPATPKTGPEAARATTFSNPPPTPVSGRSPANPPPTPVSGRSPSNPPPTPVSGRSPVPVTAPRHGTFALGVGVLAAPGSLGPWPGVTARLAALMPARLFLAVSAFASWREATAEGTEGTASVSPFAGSVVLGRVWMSRRHARLDAAIGVRVLGLSASGHPAPAPPFVTPYVAATDFVIGGGAEAELGLDVPLVGPWAFRAAVELGWLFRRPVVKFDTRSVAAVGRTMALGAVSLAAAF